MPIKLRRLLLVVGIFLTTACQSESKGPGESAVSIQPTESPAPTATPAPPPTEMPVIEPTKEVAAVESTGTADADVIFVKAVQSEDGSWTFHVTVSHPDTGWEDYADGWDVVLPDGTVLKRSESDTFTRLLLHPHETEQPFTRSQSGLVIPDGITQVILRAHDLVDGFGGQEVVVDLTAESGNGFDVETG